MKRLLLLLLLCNSCLLANDDPNSFVVYDGKKGPGKSKHIVFLTGDEEYRSEEGLPQLAKILSQRHGFKCTVLFAINPKDGSIDPNFQNNLPGAEALDSADAIVMLLRFREWPDAQMKHFVDAYLAGKPIIALRTSTHAFNYPGNSKSPYTKYSWTSTSGLISWPGGFGKHVLGETWVAHHGEHKKEATRGIIEPSAKNDSILRGITEIFGNTDVYTANPSDVKVLVRGQVLAGMQPDDPPVPGKKNDPMQPVAWTRLHRNEAGNTNKIFCTTMGAATDLQDEGLRRLIVNAVYWSVGLKVPRKADVGYVGEYKPTMYGFNGYVRGIWPKDHALTHAKNLRLSDGKTFKGWEGDTNKTWRIEKGAFVGGSLEKTVPHNDFLCTTRQFTNFVLRLKFKLVGTNGFVNGGVQFRSQRVPNDPEVSGYQADMGDPSWWGSLYDESRRNKLLVQSPADEVNKVLKRGDWNDYTIRCEGKHIQLFINGMKTVDYTEPDDAIPRFGIIGLQIHGGGKAEAWYKNIEIEGLP